MIEQSIWGEDLEWLRVEHDKKKKTWWLADLCNGHWSVCLWKMPLTKSLNELILANNIGCRSKQRSQGSWRHEVHSKIPHM